MRLPRAAEVGQSRTSFWSAHAWSDTVDVSPKATAVLSLKRIRRTISPIFQHFIFDSRQSHLFMVCSHRNPCQTKCRYPMTRLIVEMEKNFWLLMNQWGAALGAQAPEWTERSPYCRIGGCRRSWAPSPTAKVMDAITHLLAGGRFRTIRVIRMSMSKNTTARPPERTSSTIQPGASGQRCLGLAIFASFPGSSGGGHAQPVRRHPENLFG